MTLFTPPERLAPILEQGGAALTVAGHTHRQFDLTAGGRRMVNAGSVGRPYEHGPGAYWLRLGPDVELRRTDYDTGAAVARFAAAGYPLADSILAPVDADAIARRYEDHATRRSTRRPTPGSHEVRQLCLGHRRARRDPRGRHGLRRRVRGRHGRVHRRRRARRRAPPGRDAQLLAPLRPRSLRDFLAFEGHLKNAYARLGREIPAEWYEVPAYYKGMPDTVIGPGEVSRGRPGRTGSTTSSSWPP